MRFRLPIKWISNICFWLVLAPSVLRAEDFNEKHWNMTLHKVQNRALSEKISPQVINDVIQNAEYLPDVVQKDRNQPEFKMTMQQYLDKVVSEDRIKKGREAMVKYDSILRIAEARYGVPKHYIVAFWGMESNYGNYKSAYLLGNSFLTLIDDGRREEFFTKQLIALMKQADKSDLNMKEIGGSWAGGMGHFQFIPTTLELYGVDGDSDGKIDVINNFSDAVMSAGNYLNKLGWDKNEKVLREVILPEKMDRSICDGKTERTLRSWQNSGVRNIVGGYLPLDSLDMVAGCVSSLTVNPKEADVVDERAFLVYKNFYRIKRWNNSTLYAIAIGLLADKIR